MKKRAHKHYRLDPAKIKRVQKEMGAKTETEAIDRALDSFLSEREKDRLIEEAHEQFFKSGIKVRDVYGVLEK